MKSHTPLLTDAEGKREKISFEGQDTPETGNKGTLAFQKYSELVSGSLEKKKKSWFSPLRRERERGRGGRGGG